MRERAERAERQVDMLLELVDPPKSRVPLRPEQFAMLKGETEVERDIEYVLPPPVEEAISRRARPGSDLFNTLVKGAYDAMQKGGSDFDADVYAEHVTRGSRISGWPL